MKFQKNKDLEICLRTKPERYPKKNLGEYLRKNTEEDENVEQFSTIAYWESSSIKLSIKIIVLWKIYAKVIMSVP